LDENDRQYNMELRAKSDDKQEIIDCYRAHLSRSFASTYQTPFKEMMLSRPDLYDPAFETLPRAERKTDSRFKRVRSLFVTG